MGIMLSLNLINIITTCVLIGVIWVIQLVHYPSFAFVDSSKFSAFHQHHSTSISYIVLPLMSIELGLAIYFCWQNGGEFSFLLPLILVGLIWLSTFFIQVPLHQKLGKKMNLNQIHQLVQTNWIRTILWTIKGIWLIYLCA